MNGEKEFEARKHRGQTQFLRGDQVRSRVGGGGSMENSLKESPDEGGLDGNARSGEDHCTPKVV